MAAAAIIDIGINKILVIPVPLLILLINFIPDLFYVWRKRRPTPIFSGNAAV